MKIKEYDFYEQLKNWNFSEFDIKTEYFTNWDLYKILHHITTSNSKILDLGTGGGEKVLKYFPKVKEIVATDFSPAMIETANMNLKKVRRKNIVFRVMDNLKMDTPKNYFDVVVARHTVTDLKQIYATLRKDGYILIRGVDKLDCWELKRIFKRGQAYNDVKAISQIDYENVLKAGFKDVELVPIHAVEYFKNKNDFVNFLFKVPILNDFLEGNNNKEYYGKEIEKDLLDKYIERNISNKGIRLVRRYYGIIGKK